MTKTEAVIAITLAMWFSTDCKGAAPTKKCQPRARYLNDAGNKSTTVSVYWDRSASMRHFGGVVQEIVNTLDSAILPKAGVGAVAHLSVGSTVQQMRDALPALNPDQRWTALHIAAERASADLASDRVGVTIYVSDMILEIPKAERESKSLACPGVSMPSNEHAGAVFGRCFTSGLRGRTLPNLYTSLFRTTVKGRQLYVLLIGTNVPLARDINRSMETTWGKLMPDHFLIADTDTAVSAQGVSCTWSPATFLGLRLARAAVSGECKFRCEDEAQTSLMNCSLRKPAEGAWMVSGLPTGKTPPAALAFSRTTAVSESGFSVQLRCPKRGRYVTTGTTLTYPWKTSMPGSVSPDADVRRLFDSALSAFASTVPQRGIEVTFDIQ